MMLENQKSKRWKLANFLRISISFVVQVGDLQITVSTNIADNNKIAIESSISILFGKALFCNLELTKLRP